MRLFNNLTASHTTSAMRAHMSCESMYYMRLKELTQLFTTLLIKIRKTKCIAV